MSEVVVSVIYGYDTTPITAEVTVLVENNGSGLRVFPALPALSLGDWKVTWKLRPGPGVTNLKFDENIGIAFGEVPPLLSLNDSHFVSDTQWEASFTNRVESANLASYTIHGTSDEGPFNHDPAIAVVPDPPPGG